MLISDKKWFQNTGSINASATDRNMSYNENKTSAFINEFIFLTVFQKLIFKTWIEFLCLACNLILFRASWVFH